ncbi:protein tyrosine kinase [Gordonia westfalica]|uniref:Protein tyrosine kinase n=1 Tax=Gordonia westfalica TaxID=158898 RepID=A0ABU2GUJ6_9ACTN|nr:Wzz/FepE/Etk N-terminal domain-containing protein [Gordonia westfalica]MDS1114670.1 protein tyrosine kinase [Gordonia westfalica]
MPFSEYVRIVVRYWWAIVASVLVGGLAGFGYGMYFTSVDYVSSARLFVTAEGGTSVGESYQNNLFAEGRVNSYAQIATSEQVATRASEALEGAISPADLRSKTTALPVEDTVILTISVSGPSPQRAQSYAAAVAQQTVEVVQELETSRRGGTSAASAVLYDEPGLPSTAGRPWMLWTAIGAGAGLVVGVVVALLLGWRRRGTVVDEVTAVDSTHHPVLAVLSPQTIPIETLGTDDSADRDADALRGLHNLIRFLGGRRDEQARAPRVVGFTGVGSDAGAGDIAARFAATVAATGNTVLLVDGDLSGGGITAGTELSADHGLSTVLSSSTGSVDPYVGQGGLTILPAGPVPPESVALVSSPVLGTVLDDLRERFDYIVIACPRMGSTSDSIVYSALADAMVVVVRSGSATRKALSDSVAAIELVGAVVGTVLVSGKAGRAKAPDATGTDEPGAETVDAEPGSESVTETIRTTIDHASRNGSGSAAAAGVPSDGRGR